MIGFINGSGIDGEFDDGGIDDDVVDDDIDGYEDEYDGCVGY